MNQWQEEERKRLYIIKHSQDAVCANCKYCKNQSTFPQYEAYWRCTIDNQDVYNRYKQTCPAFTLH